MANDAFFTAPGVIYISGNQFGLDLEYPAASPNVIGIGITGFARDSNGHFQYEFASQFDTGGPSAYEPRPAYQDAIASVVGNSRGVPDVALICDPIYGAVVFFDSIPLDGFVGWQYSGNVGIAEAIWAAVINVAARNRSGTDAELTAFYQHLGDAHAFRDITKGQAFGNRARSGWDVLTGLGSPVTYADK